LEVPAVSRRGNADCVTLVRERFTVRRLRRLRLLVARAARLVGLNPERGQRLAMAVTEAASNAIRHGGGWGHFSLIRDDGRALIAEIRDTGPGMPLTKPVGLPFTEATCGRGLYIIQEVCDHVDYRSGPAGTTVRLRMNLDGP
jgi:anti-sigma regulatory factor (Ser/Thr protein kinase)